jgi:glyoxylase-like metal-dependent hydrolase (beta-lactamase superfamily II)
MEIAPGIHKIDGVRVANCYLIIRPDKMLLIDTGMPRNIGKILDYVKKLSKSPTDIRYIILTHSDLDHIGNASELKKITGAKLVIHAGDAPVLKGQQRQRSDKGLLHVAFLIIQPVFPILPAEPDIILQNDSELEGFRILHTPGHTTGSICIYEPGKILFTGDSVISSQQGDPLPPTKRLLSDISQSRESLARIGKLAYDILLPGHGAPVIGRASQKVQEMLSRLSQ